MDWVYTLVCLMASIWSKTKLDWWWEFLVWDYSTTTALPIILFSKQLLCGVGAFMRKETIPAWQAQQTRQRGWVSCESQFIVVYIPTYIKFESFLTHMQSAYSNNIVSVWLTLFSNWFSSWQIAGSTFSLCLYVWTLESWCFCSFPLQILRRDWAFSELQAPSQLLRLVSLSQARTCPCSIRSTVDPNPANL